MSVSITDEEMEARAKALRRSLGLEDVPIMDMMTVLCKLKHIYRGFNYSRVVDHEMPHEEAQWDAFGQVIRMRESVFCGMQRGESRARMTVAHEIAHLYLKHEGIRNRSITKSISEITVSQVKKEEHEAKRFAAVFLAPSHLIDDIMTPEDIARKFNISLSSAILRRDEVDKLNRRRAGINRELPPVVIDYLREARRRGYKPMTDID